MKLASGFIILGMTRRDAALLTLTLAGMLCLFQAVMLSFALAAFFSMPPESVMSTGNPSLQRLFSVLPLLALTCAGVALLQGRRKLATWIFGANPSHDTTAQIDAGDMRLLAVHIVGLLLFMQFAPLLSSLGGLFTTGADASPIRFANMGALLVLAIAVAFCFFRAGTVVRWLFAAGPGEGKSARYRDALAFSLGLIGAFYALTSLRGVAAGLAEVAWRSNNTDPDRTGHLLGLLMQSGGDLAMVLAGVALFVGRRGLAAFWSRLHPMGDANP
ncbi:MAG: hypothetical protein QOI24_455 [Acidobacteriota bacterium]|nr:hypothetical protein [Acidobacteriota bacterium]